jgi:Outer membrane protein beta-barrel domain
MGEAGDGGLIMSRHLFLGRALRPLLSSLALALISTAAAAQERSNTDDLFLQITLDGQSLDYRDDDFEDVDEGGGLSLRAGWGVSRLVTLYLGFTGARVDGESNGVVNDEYDWGAAELGARFNFRSGRTLVPYVDVALRGVSARDEDFDLEFRGGGIAFGGGVSYFVAPTVALDAALRIGGGAFDEVQLGSITADIDEDDFGYGEGRMSLGLTIYPLP